MRLQGIGDLAHRDPTAMRKGGEGICKGSAPANRSGNRVLRNRRSGKQSRIPVRNVSSKQGALQGASADPSIAKARQNVPECHPYVRSSSAIVSSQPIRCHCCATWEMIASASFTVIPAGCSRNDSVRANQITRIHGLTVSRPSKMTCKDTRAIPTSKSELWLRVLRPNVRSFGAGY